MLKLVALSAKNAFAGFPRRLSRSFLLLENLLLAQMLLILYKLSHALPGDRYKTALYCAEGIKALLFSAALAVGGLLLIAYEEKKRQAS